MENTKLQTLNEKRQEIINLTNDLTSPVSDIGDYRIIKCFEATLSGVKTMPYDVDELLNRRQKVRDRINTLLKEIEALEIEAKATDE